MKRPSSLELKMMMLLRSMGVDYEREYPFKGNRNKNGTYRRYKIDFAIPSIKLAIECQGGIWMKKSGHNTGKGYLNDCRKYNQLTEHGWRLLQYTTEDFKDTSEMIRQIEVCLQGGKK